MPNCNLDFNHEYEGISFDTFISVIGARVRAGPIITDDFTGDALQAFRCKKCKAIFVFTYEEAKERDLTQS